MNAKQLKRARELATLIAEGGFSLKLYMPLFSTRATKADLVLDWPLLTGQIREIREMLVEIEQITGVPAPTASVDIHWKLKKYEYPPEGVPVLLSLRHVKQAVVGMHEDGAWCWEDGVHIEDPERVFAWAPYPPSLGEARRVAGLLMLPTQLVTVQTVSDESGLRWTYVEDALPDDDTRVAIAIDSDHTDEPDYGYHANGKWWYDSAPHLSPIEAVVYAWAEVPGVPPRRKGGTS